MNIVWFKDKVAQDINIVGGKAANLAVMARLNLPVPAGFTVTAGAYKKFLEDNNLYGEIYSILDGLDVEDSEKLHDSAEKIQNIILEAKMPYELKQEIMEAYENLNIDIDVYKMAGKKALDIIKAGRDTPFVAVRSSATAEDLPTASFAGQQATFLNVKGGEEVAKSVQKCMASLFTARAIYYRVKNNFDHRKVYIAVIVQKMVNSDKAGVIFTANPSTNNEKEILIEAAFGLGEAVVGGKVTPDTYIVDKDSMKIKDKKVNIQKFSLIKDPNLGRTVKHNLFEDEGSVQKLNDNEIIKLANYSLQLEEHYKMPQDIEFAIERNKIYIVQTRAITTLKSPYVHEEERAKKPEGLEKVEIKDHVLLEGLAASPYVGTGPVKIVLDMNDLGKIQEGDVLVTKMTNPDMTPTMKKVAGIVTDEGGSTCHAAIVSREMGKASVVGTLKATEVLKEGQIVTVDGVNGKIYSGEAEVKVEKKEEPEVKGKIETVTEVKVNLDMPEYAEKAAQTNADGVGLLRCEFLILKDREHPYALIKEGRKEELVNDLADGIRKIAEAFKGKSVWYRTLDAPTDEFRHMKGGEDEPEEDNPMMGWRSIRRDLDQPELLKAQFEAIKKVHDEGYTNVGVMIPLVTHVEQVKKAKEYLMEVGLEPLEEIEFGIMIETSAAVELIDELCEEGLDFVSIGSNDLTQFTLAVDRNNARVQKWFDEMHPAVLKQLERVIKSCKKHNVEVSICGQAGSREDMAEWLVKKGIDSISANIDAVEKIRYVVYKTEKKMLLSVAREKEKLKED